MKYTPLIQLFLTGLTFSLPILATDVDSNQEIDNVQKGNTSPYVTFFDELNLMAGKGVRGGGETDETEQHQQETTTTSKRYHSYRKQNKLERVRGDNSNDVNGGRPMRTSRRFLSKSPKGSCEPSAMPSDMPSENPSARPSGMPSAMPSDMPSTSKSGKGTKKSKSASEGRRYLQDTKSGKGSCKSPKSPRAASAAALQGGHGNDNDRRD